MLLKLRSKLAKLLLPIAKSDITAEHGQLSRLSNILSALIDAHPESLVQVAATLATERQIAEHRLRTEQLNVLMMQRSAAPHQTYTPALYNDGIHWIAEGGMSQGPSLIGRGNCPAAALADYDEQWLGLK